VPLALQTQGTPTIRMVVDCLRGLGYELFSCRHWAKVYIPN
jgi:hypothetical protein